MSFHHAASSAAGAPAFDEHGFVLGVAMAQQLRIGRDPGQASRAFDAHRQEMGSNPPRFLWPAPRVGMKSESWIIARMALDIREMIMAAGGGEPVDPAGQGEDAAGSNSATVEHADLLELGWTAEQVRAFASVALAHAMASIHHQHLEARAARRRLADAALAGLVASAYLATFTIWLAMVGVATLI